MEKTTGHILKAGDVKLEGQLHLDLRNTRTDAPKEQGAALSAPEVRIIESHPEFTILEATCSCGNKIYLKCEYADLKNQVT